MLKSLLPVRPLGRLLLAAAVAVGMSTAAQAGTGWLNTYAVIWNGTADTVYSLGDQGGGTPGPISGTSVGAFNGANLGTFNTGYTLYLNSQISAWADGGDAYSQMSLYYRVYSSTPGSFTQDNVNSIDNIGGNDFRGVADDNNLSALPNGSYTLDVYLSRSHTWTGGGPYTTYLNTLGDTAGVVPTGNYFTANFEVVPEPSTYALLGVGTAFALWQLRRRRKA